MQIRSDYTKEELMSLGDPLFETHFPLNKLKTIATLLASCSPEGGLDELDENFLLGAAHIVEDATKEIEYLIDLSNQYYLNKKAEAPNV